MLELRAVARYVVFAAFCLAALVAFGAWLVRTRRLSPFGGLSRTLRSATDPVIRPIERRLVRAGSNPVLAGWWLVIGAALLGVLLLSLLDWLTQISFELAGAAHGGPRALIGLAIVIAYNVLVVALFVRVIGTWIGAFRYTRWMRPAYALTDWLVEPLRRALPQTGAFDFSPLVAWLLLWILKRLLLSIL
jgi:YggT family protein